MCKEIPVSKDILGNTTVVLTYQIKSIYIDNFKAFNEFSMDFSPMTILVGNNSSGKSSVLQALVFLKYCCERTTGEYLRERGGRVEDIATRGLAKIKKIMRFRVMFQGTRDHDILTWELTFFVDKTKNQILLRSEDVKCGEEKLLSYTSTGGVRICCDGTKNVLSPGDYPCSQIVFLNDKNADARLLAIKEFFNETEPLDLLTPRDMRRSVRSSERTLGLSGENLPVLIQQLDDDEKKVLKQELKSVLPHLRDVTTVTRRAGWTHLELEEAFENRTINVSSVGVSDGALRLLALFSLRFLKKSGGITLLDEIEDGISPQNIEAFLHHIRAYAREQKQQILLTTHSTVLLDYAQPDEIRYMFRNKAGDVVCRRFEDLNDVKEKLSYLYPGEILLNYSDEDLIQEKFDD